MITFLPFRIFAWLVGCGLAIAGMPDATAGMFVPCEDAQVFAQAATNTVVLQYSYAGPQPRVSESARRLAILMQLDLLYAQLKYRGIGVVFLSRGEWSGGCTPERVLQQLLHQVRPSRGLVFLWGKFYEQNGVLYVQSLLELHRAGRSETVALDWPSAAATYHFAAGLPITRVVFPPHEVLEADLLEIDRRYEAAARAHAEPRRESPSHLLNPDHPDEQFGFVVERVAGNWMQLKSLANKPLGWVDAGSVDPEWSLRRKLPELDFVDASVAYLQIRVASSTRGSGVGSLELLQRYLNSAVDRFAAAIDRDRGNAAMAQAAAMVGMAAVAGTGWRGAFPDAQRAFSMAASLLPSSAEARNLKVLADIEACCISNRGGPPAQTVIEALDEAVQLDPTDDQVLANLEAFYAALRSHRGTNQPALGPAELEVREREVAAARAAAKVQP
jgi:hypothetical protein